MYGQDPIATAPTAAEGDAVVEASFGDGPGENLIDVSDAVRAEAQKTGRRRGGRSTGIGVSVLELAVDAEVEPPGALELVWQVITEL